MKNRSDNELLSRREFFKRTVQKTLPFMAAMSFPSFLLSCGGDDPISNSEGCKDCTNSCLDACSKVCMDSCENGNDNSGSSGCSDCSNNCEGGCKEACANECKGEAANTGVEENPTGEIEYAVDLGLSVLWATFNVGASAPEEDGEWAGWGDYTGKKTSINPNDYPNANPPENIAGTEFDIARVQWGDGWRLPSIDEWSELDRCDREDFTLNGKKGTKITGPNGNSIFLPQGGIRHEGQEYEIDAFFFWTGEKNNTDTHAWAYNISYFGNSGVYRYDQLRTRPVLDKDNAIGCRTCASGCIIGCSSTCSGDCVGGCELSCSDSCISGCKDGCMDGCKGGCQKECTEGCVSFCSASCSNDCGGGCRNECLGTCQGNCLNTCPNSCGAGCHSDCGFNCSWACGNTCHKTAF